MFNDVVNDFLKNLFYVVKLHLISVRKRKKTNYGSSIQKYISQFKQPMQMYKHNFGGRKQEMWQRVLKNRISIKMVKLAMPTHYIHQINI